MKSSIDLLFSKIRFEPGRKANITTFLNPYSYLFFRKNLTLFSSFETIYIDGIVLVYLLRLAGIKTDRKSFDMTSIAPKVFDECISKGKTVYIIGSKEVAINKFVKILSNSFPRLNIIGHRNGYFNSESEREKTLMNIIKINPNVVVVGMGTPYQEKFLVDLKQMGWMGDGYTCGGFIHQTTIEINYYPKFFDNFNLRWVYRIIDEPKLFKRYFFNYPQSICLFIFDFLKYKISQK